MFWHCRKILQGALCAALVWVSKILKNNQTWIYSPLSVHEILGAGETTCVSIAGGTVTFDTFIYSSFWDIPRNAKQELAGANSFAFLKAFNKELL